jgi:hypothetical protein
MEINNKKESIGVVSLSDDDLDGVSGGAVTDDIEKMAKAEGRVILVPSRDAHGFCDCGNGHVWAASQTLESGCSVYHNVKCYSCGRQKDIFNISSSMRVLIAAPGPAIEVEFDTE